MKRYIIGIIILLLWQVGLGQIHREFRMFNDIFIEDYTQVGDYYYVLGREYTTLPGNTDNDLDQYFIKADTNWNIIYSKKFGGESYDYYSHMHYYEGAFILLGQTRSFSGDINELGSWQMSATKVDTLGDFSWTKTYFTGTGNTIRKAYLKPNGNVVFCAAIFNRSNDDDGDHVIVEIDQNGNTIQADRYIYDDHESGGYSFIQTSDGGYMYEAVVSLLGSTTGVGAGGGDLELVKIGNNGDIEWSKGYGWEINEGIDWTAYSSIIELESGYLVAGATDSRGFGLFDMMLLKIDFQGNVQWTKLIGNEKSNEPGAGQMISLSNNRFGLTVSRGTNLDIAFIEFDSLGTILRSRKLDMGETSSYTSRIKTVSGSKIAKIVTKNYNTTNKTEHGLIALNDDLESCIPIFEDFTFGEDTTQTPIVTNLNMRRVLLTPDEYDFSFSVIDDNTITSRLICEDPWVKFLDQPSSISVCKKE